MVLLGLALPPQVASSSVEGTVSPRGPGAGSSGTVLRLYVANSSDDTVSVLDAVTHAEVAVVPVGRTPTALVAHPGSSRVYVVNAVDLTLSVIDTASNTVVATVQLPGGTNFGFESLAVHPDGTAVYIADFLSPTVSVIDTTTHSVRTPWR
jgi:YVTN family beta-propeller protein